LIAEWGYKMAYHPILVLHNGTIVERGTHAELLFE
jgi:ABC-type transport system involved in Fe-S cluster assembly fused permease/ATPase subunit